MGGAGGRFTTQQWCRVQVLLGLAIIIYLLCTYGGISGSRGFSKYTVIHDVNIRFWPTIGHVHSYMWVNWVLLGIGILSCGQVHTHAHTHTHTDTHAHTHAHTHIRTYAHTHTHIHV
jgi:hypothetical protein